MGSDIPSLVPVSSPPLVREKRHYPSEQKDKNENKSDSSSADEQHPQETEDDLSHKPVNTDKKNVKVGHIDEYV